MRKSILTFCCFLSIVVVVDRGIGAFLKTGLERYFGLSTPADVLCVGHSRTVLGLDQKELSQGLGVSVAKFGMDGVNTFDRCAMVRYFLRRHPGVKLLLYDVESTSFTTAQLSSNTYRLFLPFVDDRDLSRYVSEHCPSRLHAWLFRFLHTTRYDEASVNRAVRGWLGFDQNLKQGRADLKRLQARIDSGRIRQVAVDSANRQAFAALMKELGDQRIRVLLWHPPTIDLLDDVNRSDRQAIRDYFRHMAEQNTMISYVEFVEAFRERHDLFYDGIHMNAKGKAVVTEALAGVIKNLGLLPVNASEAAMHRN